MPLINSLKQDVITLDTLGYIADVYSEVSALRMKKIRLLVDSNSSFYEGISSVYYLTKLIAAKKLAQKAKTLQKEKVLSIAVTSNHRFYGELNQKILRKFQEKLIGSNTDISVVGQTGREDLSLYLVGKVARLVTFEHDLPTRNEALGFLEQIKTYSKVVIYFPKFVNVYSQEVGVMDITQSPSRIEVEREEIAFIFEPELEKIVDFFETQVRYMLFMRVMLESQLARESARLWAMSAASDRASDLSSKARVGLRKAQISLRNTNLLGTLSAQIKSHAQ